MKIYYTNCQKRLTNEKTLQALVYMEPEMQEKFFRYKSWKDSQRSLFGRLLARYAIMENIGLENKNILIQQDRHGKPIVLGKHNLHFNISHSGDWVVCAISSSLVGIDVQEILEISMSIARRFFSSEENQYLDSLQENERLSGFYDIWTLKEAYVKALGVGLLMPLNEFSILRKSEGFLIKGAHDNNFYFRQYVFDERYKLSVCSRTKEFCKEMKQIDINFLIPNM